MGEGIDLRGLLAGEHEHQRRGEREDPAHCGKVAAARPKTAEREREDG